jgi:hypothetical protein
MRMWTGFVCIRTDAVVGCCEHGTGLADSIKGKELLEQQNCCRLLRKQFAA